MGDITHFLDDVTRFSPIQKNGPDRYTELGPYIGSWLCSQMIWVKSTPLFFYRWLMLCTRPFIAACIIRVCEPIAPTEFHMLHLQLFHWLWIGHVLLYPNFQDHVQQSFFITHSIQTLRHLRLQISKASYIRQPSPLSTFLEVVWDTTATPISHFEIHLWFYLG